MFEYFAGTHGLKPINTMKLTKYQNALLQTECSALSEDSLSESSGLAFSR